MFNVLGTLAQTYYYHKMSFRQVSSNRAQVEKKLPDIYFPYFASRLGLTVTYTISRIE